LEGKKGAPKKGPWGATRGGWDTSPKHTGRGSDTNGERDEPGGEKYTPAQGESSTPEIRVVDP